MAIYMWREWSSKLAWYTFKWTLVNQADTSLSANLWSGSSIWQDYATVNNSIITCPLTQAFDFSTNPFTYTIRVKSYNRPSYNPRIISYPPIALIVEHYYSTYNLILKWSTDERAAYCATFTPWVWNNITVAYSGSWNTIYLYKDGVKYTYPNFMDYPTWAYDYITLWLNGYPDDSYFYFWDFIVDTEQWTDQEVLDHYNNTKWDYTD